MVVNGVHLKPTKSTPTQIRQLMIDGCWQTSPRARLTFSDIHDILLGLGSLSLASDQTETSVSNSYYLQLFPDTDI